MKHQARFPPVLRAGDLIRVVSPAGPVDEAALEMGVRRLLDFGYSVEIAPHALARKDYIAGSDAERAEDLTDALTDPDVKGIICSRGGYGSLRLLARLPWNEFHDLTPKPFVGFSDVSAFQLQLLARCGWVSFSGLQAAHGLGGSTAPRAVSHLMGMLDGSGRRLSGAGWGEVRLRAARGGFAEGHLAPCCLRVLVGMLATPYFPILDRAILIIEDINEAPYRIDRMMWQLKAAKVLRDVSALVLGSFIFQGSDLSEAAAGIALEIFGDDSFPIWRGLPYGHIDDRLTIPVGASAAIDAQGVIELV